MVRIRSQKDFVSGILFVSTAAVFGWFATDLRIGSAFQMGPGYFPIVLSLLLSVIGAALIVNGVRTVGQPVGELQWRGIALVLLPVAFFGLTLRGLGLVVALAITVFAVTMASRKWDVRSSAMLTAGIVLFSYLLFVVALGLPIPVVGTWLGGH